MPTLGSLLEALPGANLLAGQNVEIAGICADSRTVQPGYLFVALSGEHVDGHLYAADAIAAGAVAVVAEHDVAADVRGVAVVHVPDTRIALSRIAARFYGDPSKTLRVVGITGTNGKTTTTHLVRAILDGCGVRCGYVGTLGAFFPEWARGPSRWKFPRTRSRCTASTTSPSRSAPSRTSRATIWTFTERPKPMPRPSTGSSIWRISPCSTSTIRTGPIGPRIFAIGTSPSRRTRSTRPTPICARATSSCGPTAARSGWPACRSTSHCRDASTCRTRCARSRSRMRWAAIWIEPPRR